MRRALIASVVLSVVLVACGSGSSGRAATKTSKVSTIALVTGAADAAAAARSATVSGRMSLAFGGKQVDVPIDGAIDFVRQAADLRVDMSSLVDAAGGSGAAGISGEVEIRMVDGTMYMNLGSMLGSRADAILHGKDWVAIDVSQMATEGGTQNPADMLQSLRGAGRVREVGTDDIAGVPTTHYHAEIDLQKAIEKVPAQYRDLAEQGMKMLGGSFPIDVWIDHDGLPRRFQVDIEVPGGKGSVSERLDFGDYGAPVTIEAPPAGQVQSMGDFQRVASGV